MVSITLTLINYWRNDTDYLQWKARVVTMPPLPSLVALEDVVMKTSSAANGDKDAIMAMLQFVTVNSYFLMENPFISTCVGWYCFTVFYHWYFYVILHNIYAEQTASHMPFPQ